MTGLIVGKFMPPHRGHQYLIECARSQVDALTILLFSTAGQPIPGELRLRWMRQLYPDVQVLPVTYRHQVDYQDPAAWNLWLALIRQAYPVGPDVVFSSEAYGEELARRLGARHVLVDPARACVPISATQIRERPAAYADHLPPCVRDYYQQLDAQAKE